MMNLLGVSAVPGGLLATSPAPVLLHSSSVLQPSVAVRRAFSSKRKLALKIVDRDNEVVCLLETMRQNHKFGPSLWYKPVLPYTPQAFGSGTSAFGVSALQLLRNDLARPEADQRIVAKLLQLAEPFTRAEIQEYANAKEIFINKRDIRISNSGELRLALYRAIYEAATGKESRKVLGELRRPGLSAKEFVAMIQRKSGGKLFYLFLDETGALADLNLREASKDATSPFRMLLTVLKALLSTGSVFAYVADDRGMLAKAAQLHQTNPCSLHALALSPLSAAHIEEVIRSSNGRPHLSLLETLEKECQLRDPNTLAQGIYRWTAGVPVQVQRCLQLLLRLRCNLSTEAAIDAALATEVREAIIAESKVFQLPELRTKEARDAYAQLLASQAQRAPFAAHAREGEERLVDWAAKLGVHVAPRPERTYQVVVSPYTVEYLLNRKSVAKDP